MNSYQYVATNTVSATIQMHGSKTTKVLILIEIIEEDYRLYWLSVTHGLTPKATLPLLFADGDYTYDYNNGYDFEGDGGAVECEFDGRRYADGETFSPEDCTRCTCSAGQVSCEQTPCDQNCVGVLCPEIECENQYIPLGSCCPVCPGRFQPTRSNDALPT